jgi:anti-repressor protein
MNELIKINNENKVDGRSLHEFLQIETPFKKWIDRMLEYGFVEGVSVLNTSFDTFPS